MSAVTGDLTSDFDRKRDDSDGEDHRGRKRYDDDYDRRDADRGRYRDSDRYRDRDYDRDRDRDRGRDYDRDRDRDYDRYRDSDRYRDRRRDFGRDAEEGDRYRDKGGDYRPSVAHRTADTYREEPARGDRHRDSDSKSDA